MLDIFAQVYEPLGSWIGGNRDRKRFVVSATAQIVFSSAALFVAASFGPIGWAAIAYFAAAGAAANVSANVVTALLMNDQYTPGMLGYDVAAGATMGALPGAVTASVWVTAGARVTMTQVTNAALHLAGAGPSIGNGVLRDRVFLGPP